VTKVTTMYDGFFETDDDVLARPMGRGDGLHALCLEIERAFVRGDHGGPSTS